MSGGSDSSRFSRIPTKALQSRTDVYTSSAVMPMRHGEIQFRAGGTIGNDCPPPEILQSNVNIGCTVLSHLRFSQRCC